MAVAPGPWPPCPAFCMAMPTGRHVVAASCGAAAMLATGAGHPWRLALGAACCSPYAYRAGTLATVSFSRVPLPDSGGRHAAQDAPDPTVPAAARQHGHGQDGPAKACFKRLFLLSDDLFKLDYGVADYKENHASYN